MSHGQATRPVHHTVAAHFSHSPYKTAAEGKRTSENQPVHVRKGAAPNSGERRAYRKVELVRER